MHPKILLSHSLLINRVENLRRPAYYLVSCVPPNDASNGIARLRESPQAALRLPQLLAAVFPGIRHLPHLPHPVDDAARVLATAARTYRSRPQPDHARSHGVGHRDEVQARGLWPVAASEPHTLAGPRSKIRVP